MSTTSPTPESRSSQSRHGALNELQCMIAQFRFESEWESGRRPRAEDFVAHRPIEERADLIPRLLAVEISIRRRTGNEPARNELIERFPECPDVVENALRQDTQPFVADPDESTTDESAIPAFGRYRVIGRIGKGGFGEVYNAFDDKLNRMVAIKVPHVRWGARREFPDSYLTEARVLARLDHPHIVPVFDYGTTEDGRPFVVSKLIEGLNLAERLAQGRPPFAVTRSIVAEIADALHYAHLQGIVHRDVKPGNILIEANGKAYLADFGIVLREEEYGQGPSFAGTPAYMSPEQARSEGHRVDGRSDVFSLGVVLFQLLTGRRPFHANTDEDLLNDVIETDAQPPRQIDDVIPRELERICLKALSKRASDRYPTARDMADDLRQSQIEPAPSVAGDAVAVSHALPSPTSSVTPSSDQVAVRIVPKGLRSFDDHDADFFLELLPGPRDRDGLPDSVRFWKCRIEETDSDETFSVGLIYGPSGCGKSSLIKAGLLPRLAKHVQAIYIEATTKDTETRLLGALHKRFPRLAADGLSLQESLAALRRGQCLAAGQKAFIVIDQFEQWLHSHADEQNAELPIALRQCDGTRVQVLLLVRDDFWMSISRLFDLLEIHLNQTRNARAMDLFDPDHARRVLRMFGEAYDRLPRRPQPLSADQKDFLNKAVSELTRDGHVIPVRLSLFADMMKERAWTSASLFECGGADGVGVRFLEETFFSRSALPELRMLEQPARNLLQAFLPERGADIKGRMRSRQELAMAAGLTGDPQRFTRLLDLFDRELHILTPAEPARDAGATAANDSSPAGYYQLTHDYLVPSLRQWLTRERQKTWRGRAELCLEERTRQWTAKKEAGFLPSVPEYVSIAGAVSSRKRSPEQKELMRAARRHHGVRWGGAAVAVAALLVAIWFQQRAHRAKVVEEAVNDLLIASADGVPLRIDRLLQYESQAKPLLRTKFDDPATDPSRKLRAAFGLAAFGSVEQDFLLEVIPLAAGGECTNIVAALRPAKDAVSELLLSKSLDPNATPADAARYGTILLHFGDARAVQSLVALGPDPTRRTAFIVGLEKWHGDLAPVAAVLRESEDGPLSSALIAAVGLIEPSELGLNELQALQSTVAQRFQNAPDGGTRAAAQWLLRHWKMPAPAIASLVATSGTWSVNSMGVTMMKIPAGTFTMGNTSEGKWSQPFEVTLRQPYWMSDCPIRVGLFSLFLTDPNYPRAKKPADWQTDLSKMDPDLPIHSVTWEDCALFCNWMSHREGLEECYELIEASANQNNPARDDANDVIVIDGWKWYHRKNGYRLPTEAERERACRALTTTNYSFGDNMAFLPHFAVVRDTKLAPVASRLPNPWGLFDMHGNVKEWCWDQFRAYPTTAQVDPMGRSGGTGRVIRGGAYYAPPAHCTSTYRSHTPPTSRLDSTGFRVVWNGATSR